STHSPFLPENSDATFSCVAMFHRRTVCSSLPEEEAAVRGDGNGPDVACVADELAERAARQIIGGEKAVAAAADYCLAVGREGEGAMGVAGILAALDGGEDLAGVHHIEQVEFRSPASAGSSLRSRSPLGRI